MEETLPELGGQLFVRRGQDVTFAAMHEIGFDGVAVVVADEMENAVRDEQLELEGEGHAKTAGLSLCRLHRDHDLADESSGRLGDFQREGEDVRPPPDATERAIEATNLHVVDERDLDAGAGSAQRPERTLGRMAQRPERDENVTLAVLDGRAH
jgi:hypothetical protein